MRRRIPKLWKAIKKQTMSAKKSILFLCTGNSCRSQIAEGLCRHFRGDLFDVYSAGIKKHGLNPRAVKVMQEIGIDISSHYSKTLDELGEQNLDYVITVCGHANETCPVFIGTAKKIHHGFDDPPALAADAKTEEEALAHFRRVRDEIKDYVLTLPEALA